MGGFVGPEIRFAGYEGIIVTGKSDKPVYLLIENDKVKIKDASAFWGLGTDELDMKINKKFGGKGFESLYIGPAGERMVSMACVLNTAARASGRGGAGAVMGSKKLKAIIVKGTGMPKVADHKKMLDLFEKAKLSFANDNKESLMSWRFGGTANALEYSSSVGTQAVKNYREGTYEEIAKIGAKSARKEIWKRDFACYSCHLSCKKSGFAKGAYGAIVHDGPEYETGTMLGANLLISDLGGLNKLILLCDDYGLDIISVGNAIGFLMEAYDRKYIDKDFLDGIDLTWGNIDASIEMVHKIAKNEGIGMLAGKGVKLLSEKIGKDSAKFAIHVKGHELAAWNVQARESMGVSYVTANRGACHMNGGNPQRQNGSALRDSLGACNFAASWYKEEIAYHHFLSAITGVDVSETDIAKSGERIFNLEKMINYREGFDINDDVLPDRFFEDKLTVGPKKGAVLNRETFKKTMQTYYEERKWNTTTSRPTNEKLDELSLAYLADIE
jgi:aldehyde:ferredoxin oxidoreductase